MTTPLDPVDLTRKLVRCASVTPEEGGAIELLERTLDAEGFETFRADRNGIANLVARFGPKGHPRSLGFNGHSDVVPPGDPKRWTHPPFEAVLKDGVIWGRGATDMKSGVAAFVAAAVSVAADEPDGAILLTVTGDEEGDADHGTQAILDWMAEHGEAMDLCVVAEPSSGEALGDVIKIGRRGSMSAWITVTGQQGHTAYPHLARNPVHGLLRYLDGLLARPLDEGTGHFDPSTIQVTTIDVGNTATNVVPSEARAALNIRFNDLHDGSTLEAMLRERAAEVARETGVDFDLRVKISGEAFLTEPGRLTDLAIRAVRAETGLTPAMTTGGGTSDARFIAHHCPVVEVGLTNATIHQIDERVAVAEIEGLTRIFRRMMRDYFAA